MLSKFKKGMYGIIALLFIGPASAEKLKLYCWGDYINPKVIEAFEKKTGIDVTYDAYESNELLEAKLLAGNSGYDVVVPSSAPLARQIKAGVYMKLDKSKLKNLGNMWDVIEEKTAQFDPGNAYSVNYMWGTVGIGYNEQKVEAALGKNAPVDSLALVFDPENMKKLQASGIYFLESVDDILPLALRYLNEDPNSEDPEVLAKAQKLLESIQPYITKFSNYGAREALQKGDIAVAIGWNGAMIRAANEAAQLKNGPVLKYSIPKEGTIVWFDQIAILKDAPNPDAAHKFLDHMMDPEMAALNSDFAKYANGNKASQAFMDKKMVDNKLIYPSDEVMKTLFVVKLHDAKITRMMTRLWTKIKTGK